MPLNPGQENLPLEEVLRYLSQEKKLTMPEAVQRRMQFVDVLAGRLAKRSDLTPMHTDFVRSFLQDLILLQAAGKKSKVIKIGLLRFEQPTYLVDLDLFGSYNKRYNPAELVKRGAMASEVNDPGISVFSSLESFRWLQDLAANGIQYANVDYRDPGFYRHVAGEMKKENLKGLAVSVTNIIDCNDYVFDPRAKCSIRRNLNDFLSMLSNVVDGLRPVYVHYVKGTHSHTPVHHGEIGELMKEKAQHPPASSGQTHLFFDFGHLMRSIGIDPQSSLKKSGS